MLSSASPESCGQRQQPVSTSGDRQLSWLRFFLLNLSTQAWTLWPSDRASLLWSPQSHSCMTYVPLRSSGASKHPARPAQRESVQGLLQHREHGRERRGRKAAR